MRIVHVPNSVLSATTKPVAKIDSKIRSLVKKMIVTLEQQNDPEGVGLAANQVGFSLSLFIMKPHKKSAVTVCINPHIVKRTMIDKEHEPQKKHKRILEGCLSIPRLWGHVSRGQKVQLEYTDLEGRKHSRWFSGFEAVIVQHEMDHLLGIVFTQRVLEQGNQLYKEVKGEFEPYSI